MDTSVLDAVLDRAEEGIGGVRLALTKAFTGAQHVRPHVRPGTPVPA